jgi:CRISPR-associated endonuclease/helicase Cas3
MQRTRGSHPRLLNKNSVLQNVPGRNPQASLRAAWEHTNTIMPKIEETTKQQRLERLHLLLTRHPLGLTEAELAEETGLERRSVNNYLRELETQGRAYKDGLYWLPFLLKEGHLRPFDLSPEEAVTLYLGARLLAKQHDKRNEPAETALLKLASVLKADAGVGDEIEQAARELAGRPVQAGYQPIFRDMVRGYIYRKKVVITYRPLNWDKPFETTFSTYLLEPSPIGFSTYLIGHSSIVNALRAYKLERIEAARLTRDDYAIPPDFPGLDMLRNAWSIVVGDETVRVVLRFSPQVKARVLETRWHPSQATGDDPEKPGWLRWQVDVADTLDLLPWVRGWGADCEVVAPEGLRKELEIEAKNLAWLYHVAAPQPNTEKSIYHLWAKADKKTLDIHRLPYHLMDVGQTALAIWQTALNDAVKQEIADWLHLSVTDAGRLIAFWASLHDLGKASPAFQNHRAMPGKLRDQMRRELEAQGFKFPNLAGGDQRARHETMTTHTLSDAGLLAQVTPMPAGLISKLCQALGGHHGAWPTSLKIRDVDANDLGGEEWTAARLGLLRELADYWKPPAVTQFQPDELRDNVMWTLVSGIVSVADWLGSDEQNFPYEAFILPLDVYARHAWQHAQYALLRAEWQSAPKMPSFDFERAFGFAPREAQQNACAQLAAVSWPAIAILEAPMGSGKTETALAVYAQWAKDNGHAGLYVAMPTTATSNQMHGRVADFLTRQFGEDIEPLLVHGQALLKNHPEESSVFEEGDADDDYAGEQAWFLPRKKSLLAPFGVGTVDQAFMSILQTKHFFVRLLGLHHKVVIFDEVHAYDAYMSELFTQLLIWLRQIGASVILLSATLPQKTRNSFVQAFTGSKETLPEKHYPRLTIASQDGKPDVIELPRPENKVLGFDWLPRDEEAIIQRLETELQSGGCAVVICNTVGRAQKLYQRLAQRETPLCSQDDLILFHARYPLAWREEIERKVLDKFGPNPNDKSQPNPQRPQKAILIATQVVEQSLDLDFDVLISDHAPLDLLLQRAGRLQRHKVNGVERDQPFRLWVAIPPSEGELPKLERADKKVYDEYILLRSWLALQAQPAKQIDLPGDFDTLIEAVYGAQEPAGSPAVQAALAKARQEMLKKEVEAEDMAEERMVREPSFRRLLYQSNMELEEDDPRVHKAFRALTRNGDLGISVICLHRLNEQLYLDPFMSKGYDPSKEISSTMIRELLRCSINVRFYDPAVEQCLLTDLGNAQIKKILERWKRIAALRYHRVAIFEDGICSLPGTGYTMSLKKESQLGLQIQEAS